MLIRVIVIDEDFEGEKDAGEPHGALMHVRRISEELEEKRMTAKLVLLH